MTKRGMLFISLFFLFLILFIAAILIGEYKNISALKLEDHLIPITEEVISYRKTNLAIWTVNLLMTFLIPMFFLFTGLSHRLMNIVETTFKNKFLSIGAYASIYLIISFLIKLPLSYYGSFVVTHRYGLSNQTIARWVSNLFKSLAMDLVVWILFLWFPYYLIYRYNRRWWLYLGLLAAPILLLVTYITPTFIDPLFNKYTSIQNTSLKLKVKEQLERAGIEDCKVYQVNKSIDTKNMNAYMTGTMKAKRIVLWDTTIENLTEDEIIAILSHEIGHYIEGHIWKSIVLGSVLITLIFFLTNKICLWLIKNSCHIFGFKKLYQIASLPLILLVINGLIFLSSPIINVYSRHHERQADRIELELTEDPETFVSVLTKLYEQSLSLPRPSRLYRFWYYSHPTYEERVSFAISHKTE